MKPANPENVPLDKIPAGWRLIYEEECDVKIPTRLWNVERREDKSAIFSNRIEMALCHAKDFTYITPDLPDNGQPWHAHKPGDPAPVEDGVCLDLVLKDGQVVNAAWAPKWRVNEVSDTKQILFYRLHEPAPVKTEPSTFEVHGHTWFRHTPGDPCPVDGIEQIFILCDYAGSFGIKIEGPTHASRCFWNGNTSLIGWRYADQPVAKPAPPTSDRILSILIAAGHLTEEQVEQARKLVKP